jgi:hypothetical protein
MLLSNRRMTGLGQVIYETAGYCRTQVECRKVLHILDLDQHLRVAELLHQAN